MPLIWEAEGTVSGASSLLTEDDEQYVTEDGENLVEE